MLVRAKVGNGNSHNPLAIFSPTPVALLCSFEPGIIIDLVRV